MILSIQNPLRLFAVVCALSLPQISFANPCDWVDEEIVRLLADDLPELGPALARARQGRTKQQWITQLESLLTDLQSKVPGQTKVVDETEIQRVIGDKVIGTANLFRPPFDRSGKFAIRLHGETVAEYQGQGVFKLLVIEAMTKQPNIGVIATTLSGTNSEIIYTKLKEGMPLEEAVKHTPAWKTRASLGFTEILYLRATFGRGPQQRFELIVGRDPSIVESNP